MKKLIILLLITLPLTAAQTGTLTVTVTNLRTTEGVIKIALFNSEKGFPKIENAIRKSEIPANGKTTVTYNNIPYGTYAITVMHDENGNGKLDTKMMVIPAEGVGTSNNPKLTGPPSFKKAKFEFNSEKKTVVITLAHL